VHLNEGCECFCAPDIQNRSERLSSMLEVDNSVPCESPVARQCHCRLLVVSGIVYLWCLGCKVAVLACLFLLCTIRLQLAGWYPLLSERCHLALLLSRCAPNRRCDQRPIGGAARLKNSVYRFRRCLLRSRHRPMSDRCPTARDIGQSSTAVER